MKKLIKVILVIVAIIVMANYVGNKEESQTVVEQKEEVSVTAEESFIEEESVEEVSNNVEEPIVEEVSNDVESDTDVSENIMAELFKTNLENHMGQLVDVHYYESEKTYQLVAHDEGLRDGLILVALGYDFPEWQTLVDSQVELSQTLLDTVGAGYTIAIANPENPENNFLVVMDGEVIYDVSVGE